MRWGNTVMSVPTGTTLIGAAIICASGLYILGNGRVAGIAGVVASPLRAILSGRSLAPEWTRLLFIAGLLLAPWLWRLAAPLPATNVDVGTLAVAAVAKSLGLSETTIYDLVTRKELKALRIGRAVRIPVVALAFASIAARLAAGPSRTTFTPQGR